MRRAEDQGVTRRCGRTAAAARCSSRPRGGALASAFGLFTVLALLLFASGPAVASDTSPFDFAQPVPERFLFAESYESKPPSFSFRRNESRLVEAPTRYRTSSILKYTTPLGDTGLILRIKLPLKQRKLIKFEVRF